MTQLPMLKGCRPEVLAFVLLMERELQANDHKPGWKDDSPLAIAERVREEAGELWRAVSELERQVVWADATYGSRGGNGWGRKNPVTGEPQIGVGYEPMSGGEREAQLARIGSEAADVANMAMMVADVCGQLLASRDPEAATWWMIERDDMERRPMYFAWAHRPGELPTRPHGSHRWTEDWQKGERFATKEEAEAHTNHDPLLHVREHSMMAGQTDPEAAKLWQPIETAPKDETPVLLAVRGYHPERPNGHGQFVTVARWQWSPDARLPHEQYPDDGGFLELNNKWGDGWGGNIGDRCWMPLPEPPALGAANTPEQT